MNLNKSVWGKLKFWHQIKTFNDEILYWETLMSIFRFAIPWVEKRFNLFIIFFLIKLLGDKGRQVQETGSAIRFPLFFSRLPGKEKIVANGNFIFFPSRSLKFFEFFFFFISFLCIFGKQEIGLTEIKFNSVCVFHLILLHYNKWICFVLHCDTRASKKKKETFTHQLG